MASEEPSTSGKVTLQTNYGNLEIDLWCTEAPDTSRHLQQAFIDGLFDRALFSRIVPGCLIEVSGDPKLLVKPMPRKELHPKLKFNRRGIVSLTSPNTLVLTLAEVPALDS